MSPIPGTWRRFHAGRHPLRPQPDWLWRNPTHRPNGVGSAEGSRAAVAVVREAVGSGSTISIPVTIMAPISPTRYPGGSSSLSGRPDDHHQGGRSARSGQILASGVVQKGATDAVHDNLRHLGLDVLDVVNLRVGAQFGPNNDFHRGPLSVLAELQAQGLIRHIGLSNISARQFAEGEKIAKIVMYPEPL